MPDPSRRTSPQPTGKPPRQGALVVVLSAMLMVNLSVVIVLLTGDWFDKPGPAQGPYAAQTPTDVPEDRPGPAAPVASTRRPTEPAASTGQGLPVPTSIVDTQADADDSTPPSRPATQAPEPVAAPAPAIEFFGVPLFE